MPGEDQQYRNEVMAAYVMALCQGETIKAIAIKSDTIRRYLCQAIMLSTQGTPQLVDPTKDTDGRRSLLVQCVLDDHTRWESMPNRREPLTKAMVKAQFARCRKLRRGPLHIDSAMADWLALGLQTGYRRGEWAQESADPGKIVRNHLGLPRSAIITDFVFYGPRRRQLPGGPDQVISAAATVDIVWRTQKNRDNGQRLTFAANTADPELCPVAAALRIRRRAQQLGLSVTAPLEQYRAKGTRTLIHSNIIRRCLRRLAKYCYNLTRKEDLDRYTAHSIRVGACVALHVAGKSTDFIKAALRWKSDAFQMYLRNVVALAEQRNTAINATDPDGAAVGNTSVVDLSGYEPSPLWPLQ